MKRKAREKREDDRRAHFDKLRKENKIPTGDKRPGRSSCKKG